MTDEQIAKDYADGIVLSTIGTMDKQSKRMPMFDGHDLEDACLNGIKLEREKAMRFAEFTSTEQWEFCSFSDGLFWMPINGETLLDGRRITSELYTSKEFEDYLQSLKK